ncbi:MAG: restriction endonuclease [Chloroflexi bacterium]|nr:restriction endonuclease [Chloroflexota bacterium]
MMTEFYSQPILNSPYDHPEKHWKLDGNGLPTGDVEPRRRLASYVTPVPKPRQTGGNQAQAEMVLDEGTGLTTAEQVYSPTTDRINQLREQVMFWRQLKNPADWRVTPETAQLLQHWRHHAFSSFRPFFCQVEAMETLIWLTEVAPKTGNDGRRFLDHLEAANEGANPGLPRLALKLATGSGKTTIMAMIIAWQTINAVRRPNSKRFTSGFLVVTPGITIRDRLRVLQPNDPDAYYESRELVPRAMLGDLGKARIVVTNYHAFKLRETLEISKGSRALLQGRGPEIQSVETEGQMMQRVMPELMDVKNLLVLNDEAHHCYREKPGDSEEEDMKGDDRKEADKNKEAARLWINGLEAVDRTIGLRRIVDLSATPFFLKGSGYVEGTLFPWTMSDFSLMDAIECGIVKLPRVPVSDNITDDEMPRFRNLWENIRTSMPKKGRGKAGDLDPLSIPIELQTALDALYGHYDQTAQQWEQAGMDAPPCFIVVCNNTATSKLVYDYIAGFERTNEDGTIGIVQGKLPRFQNYDENLNARPQPRTVLIDSQQLESGELDANFRKVASEEIDRFRRDLVQRTGDQVQSTSFSDADLLREVMNTVGKPGSLGGSVRCVVSVAMLTEGWDANTVTHVLGVRAFGTQLLCEQVIGRALRRQSYDLNDDDLFNVEYADVLGIPFDFTARPQVVTPRSPRVTVQVRAVRPERDALEIRFPRVAGYRVELPSERLTARFNEDSTLVLTPDLVGPSVTRNEGLIGEGVNLTLAHLKDMRQSTLIFHLTKRLIETKWRDGGETPKFQLFGQLKRITRQWLDSHLVCKGGTYPHQLMYQALGDEACERITRGIVVTLVDEQPVKVLPDPYNPTGSTSHVNFTSSAKDRWKTSAAHCHINWAICHSRWESEFCRVAESHPQVLRYVKNHNMGFEVPYHSGSELRQYVPDFIVVVDDGRGPDDPLHLVVEIKGRRLEDAKAKKQTMETYWVPGVNNLGSYGRWAFAELTDPYEFESDMDDAIDSAFDTMLKASISDAAAAVAT